jgi:hypothetical protein
MLKSVDILIGLSVIMLVVSMAVTLITQAITNLLQSRGRHLLRGITDLLEQLHSGMTQELANCIAGMALKHPLIRGSQRQLGTVVHREELTKLLIHLASQAESQPANSPQVGCDSPPEKGSLKEKGLVALRQLLKDNGIEDPAKTLENVRALALQLEKSNPKLANNARQNLAILHEASSEFVAKMNAWFDPIIDRVAERFTFSTRIVTFVSASIVAVALQLDTVSLVNRLAMDDTLRNAFVQQALANQPGGSQQEVSGGPDAAKSKEYYAFLAKAGLISLPSNFGDWRNHWAEVNLSGVLVSTLLLSLGAPFWYSALSNLLRLRSVLASKDDVQRSQRQSSQGESASPSSPISAAPPALVGERGDSVAVG